MPRNPVWKLETKCEHGDGLICLVAANKGKTFHCTGSRPEGCGVYLILKNGGTV